MSEWQPIETAPKDGSDLLLFNGQIFIGSWSETGAWFDDRRLWSDTMYGYADPQPTYWMPLPQPPMRNVSPENLRNDLA